MTEHNGNRILKGMRAIFRGRRNVSAQTNSVPPTSLRAREATASDLPAIHALLTAEAQQGHFSDLDTPIEIENYVRQLQKHTDEFNAGRPAGLHLQILAVGNEIVGFVVLRASPQPSELELHMLVIASDHRRRGYARDALQDIVNTLTDSNRRLLVRCFPASTAMMSLVNSLGFRQKPDVGLHVRHYLSPTAPIADRPLDP